ncbi:MAG: hypothetical protein JWR26_1579 [Pedosphaera sp.]|nr:hypothetical protein [Pedosphaera sp.]
MAWEIRLICVPGGLIDDAGQELYPTWLTPFPPLKT